MDLSLQIEPTSTVTLLTCLGLAIDETKLIRSIKNFREIAGKLREDSNVSGNLKFLNRQIANLEAELENVRIEACKVR